MSTGGVFMLITNDGKQDKMLMATELLTKRLFQISEARKNMENPNPTLSDIEKTHVLFMNAHFKPFVAMAYEYNKVTATNPTLGSQVQLSIPQFGDFFSDMVAHVVLEAPTVSPSDAADDVGIYRWCDYPGERLFQRVAFDVNGNPLDEYYPDTYNFHRQFCVGESKMTAWNRCMGQEEPRELIYDYVTTAGAEPQNKRASMTVRDGFQTYKTTHDNLEMFIPLLFWFNTDPRLAIPSVSIPYGQRYINIQLATAADLLVAKLNPGSNASPAPTVTMTTPIISTFNLYINNIFVQPDIHDIFIARIGFSLIRVHRRQVCNINKSSDNILLQQLKWPIETMYVGIRPDANVSTVDSLYNNNMDFWHRFGKCAYGTVASAGINGMASVAARSVTQSNHINNIKITAHGVPLYNDIPSTFFNSYVPYQYGGWNISAPSDIGAFMITFCLYPGTYQPSGHVNVSRAREFYFQYSSSYVDSSHTATIFVNAVSINFLLISDGSATLRYAT